MRIVTNVSTRNLVDRAQKGDQGSFRALFDQFSGPIFRFSARFVRDRETAKDLTQEVFVTVFQKLGELRDPDAFRPWLFRIAMTACSRHARQQRREAQRPLNLDVLRLEEAELAEPILREIKLEAVVQAIQSLENPQHRLVVEMFYSDEKLTAREIGQQLNLPVSTVTSTLCRARKLLRRRALILLQEQLQAAGAS